MKQHGATVGGYAAGHRTGAAGARSRPHPPAGAVAAWADEYTVAYEEGWDDGRREWEGTMTDIVHGGGLGVSWAESTFPDR